MTVTQPGEAKPRINLPIRAAVLYGWGDRPGDAYMAAVRACLSPQDTMEAVTPEHLAAGAFDVVFVTQVCGYSNLPERIAAAGLPALCLEPHRGFHAYHAAFNDELRARGGTVLPARFPEEMEASIRAVRSGRALRGAKLLVVEPVGHERRNAQIRTFAKGCRERMGLEIVVRDTAELHERALACDDAAADAELARWYAEVFEGPGEMGPAYMREAAKLYLAEKAMLTETGAVGITPQDIGGFLTIPKPVVMPNITYGPLALDGYLVCEEGDAEALATQLILYAALGKRPTMSNLYFAYRDRFAALASYTDYTEEMTLADCRQCFADNRVTMSHFSTAGVIPPGMMVESRYRVRETVPAWPGQAMIWATPKLGPMVMARLGGQAERVHLEYGEADGLGFGDQYGWYRGRWFIRLPDVRSFAARCMHHHYAVAPDSGDHQALETLLHTLLKLKPV
jgi:L-fucose isomerase-like protein